jgi:hypothetical protein
MSWVAIKPDYLTAVVNGETRLMDVAPTVNLVPVDVLRWLGCEVRYDAHSMSIFIRPPDTVTAAEGGVTCASCRD